MRKEGLLGDDYQFRRSELNTRQRSNVRCHRTTSARPNRPRRIHHIAALECSSICAAGIPETQVSGRRTFQVGRVAVLGTSMLAFHKLAWCAQPCVMETSCSGTLGISATSCITFAARQSEQAYAWTWVTYLGARARKGANSDLNCFVARKDDTQRESRRVLSWSLLLARGKERGGRSYN